MLVKKEIKKHLGRLKKQNLEKDFTKEKWIYFISFSINH